MRNDVVDNSYHETDIRHILLNIMNYYVYYTNRWHHWLGDVTETAFECPLTFTVAATQLSSRLTNWSTRYPGFKSHTVAQVANTVTPLNAKQETSLPNDPTECQQTELQIDR